MFSTGWMSGFIILMVPLLLILLPTWRICAKAGYPGALSLVVLIPGVVFVLLFFLAFSDWPALQRRQ